MKKGLLILVPALLLSLTACDLGSLAEKLGGNGDDGETSQNAGDNSNGNVNSNNQGDDDSIFDKTESVDKLMAYGKDTGFEIVTVGSESDGTANTSFTLGMKGNAWWLIDEDGYGVGYRLENNVCSSLTYDSEAKTWSVLIANIGETQYKEMFASQTDYLYKANNYFANEGFASNGSGKYAGRDVLKYKYHRAVATVSIDHEYYVDKELGICIYQYAATTSDGDTSWAKLETTSFKTGNDVSPITIAQESNYEKYI